MAYEKTNWQNSPSTATPLNADNLNHAEQGIYDAHAKSDVVNSNIAPAYSTSTTYKVGDYVNYNNLLYKCITDISTAEEWTNAHWQTATIGDDIVNLKGVFGEQINDIEPKYRNGYLNRTDGHPMGISQAGSNRYFEIQVFGGEHYQFSGNYPNDSSWPLVFGYDSTGTPSVLVGGGDKLNWEFSIPDNIRMIRGWSDISARNLKISLVNTVRKTQTDVDELVYKTFGRLPAPRIGYIDTNGVIHNQNNGTNRYIVVADLHGGERFKYSGSYGTSGWGLVYSVDENGNATSLFNSPQENTIFTTPNNCVKLMAWSDTALKALSLEYLDNAFNEIDELFEDIENINDTISYDEFSSFGITYEPSYGYISKQGAIVKSQTPTGDNRYYQIKGLKGGESFIYSGEYPNDSTWGLAFSVDANGVITQLFSGPKTGYAFTVPNDCVELRCWGDTRNNPLVLIYGDSLNQKIEAISSSIIPRLIVVDVNGDGDFTDIQSAIDFALQTYNTATESVTIYIKDGVYNVTPTADYPFYAIDKKSNKINICGESRDGTIIRCVCTNTRQGIALNIGGECTIENLTIENLADTTYTPETILEGNHRPYCLHNDSSWSGEENGKYHTTVKNCKFYSECDTPIGAGMHTNQIQRYENVECVYAQNAVIKQQGSFYLHGPYSASFHDIGGAEVIDCVFVCYNTQHAISMHNVSGTIPWSQIPMTFVRNITYTAGSTEVSLASTSSITPFSKGNSNSTLNK